MKQYLCFILILFCSCGFISCKEKAGKSAPYLVRSFKNTGNWDSVYLYSDGHLLVTENENTKVRYFLFSYTTTLKSNYDPIYGDTWFSCSNFPSKIEIDSVVYDALPNKKSCYMHIIILSIHEFSETDYFNFDNGFKGMKSTKFKKPCQ